MIAAVAVANCFIQMQFPQFSKSSPLEVNLRFIRRYCCGGRDKGKSGFRSIRKPNSTSTWGVDNFITVTPLELELDFMFYTGFRIEKSDFIYDFSFIKNPPPRWFMHSEAISCPVLGFNQPMYYCFPCFVQKITHCRIDDLRFVAEQNAEGPPINLHSMIAWLAVRIWTGYEWSEATEMFQV